jgi:hypothetical protein
MTQGTLAMSTGFERYSKKTRRAALLRIKKNATQVFTLCALSNLFLLRRRLRATRGA